MRFLCVPCSEAMVLGLEGGADVGGLAFQCPVCGHEVVMQTNSGESKLIQSLGMQVGAAQTVSTPVGAGDNSDTAGASGESLLSDPRWSTDAEERLAEHPSFLQPLIRRSNTDYARREGLSEITSEVMDRCWQAQVSP